MSWGKLITVALLAAMVLPFSCERAEILPKEAASEFFATIPEGGKSGWALGEQISINGEAIYVASRIEEAGAWFSASAPFAGISARESAVEAFYPYTLARKVLPAEQASVLDGSCKVPLRAWSENGDLDFKMLTGILHLNLTAVDSPVELSRISLWAPEPLSGPFTVGPDGAAVVDAAFGVLTYSYPVTVSEAVKTVSFAVPQGNYSSLSVLLRAGNGSEVSFPLEGFSIERATPHTLDLALYSGDFIPANRIYYYTADGSLVTPYGMHPVSNTYEDGVGVMVFASDVYTIASHAFDASEAYSPSSVNLKRILLPPSVRSFGTYAFQNCTSLESFTLPRQEGFATLPASTFTGCTSLRELYVPDNVTKINNNTFQNCTSLVKVRLPDAITHIPQNYFNGCESLKEVNIPSALTTLGVKAFMGTALETVTLPAGLESIPSQTFQNCRNLKEIHLQRGESDEITSLAHANALAGCSSLTGIYVPASSLERYKTASGWSNYASIIYAAQ